MSKEKLKKIFKNKKILITGATGSIGMSILKELIKYNCNVIRALSNDENGLYGLSQELKIDFNENNFENSMQKKKIRLIHGDITDLERCKTSCENIDYVIHAAAMKHVPICEYNPFEAHKVNVVGTQNMVLASLENKVKKFLFISTDKVVEPTSVLGCTKLLAEKIVINSNSIKGRKSTIFSCVRFGNVIGTRGSILPMFIDQIKSNKKLTVTNKEMTRFFMTKSESTNAIINSIYYMKGSEIFVPKKLVSFKIDDLAKSIIQIYNKNLKLISYIGKRPGEKLHEKLIANYELENLHENNNFYVIKKENKNKKTFRNSDFTKSNLTNQMSINQIKKFLKKNSLLNLKNQ